MGKYDFLSYRVDAVNGIVVTSAILRYLATLHPSKGGPDVIDIDASFLNPLYYSKTYNERWKSNYVVLGDSIMLKKGADITLTTQKNMEFVLAIALDSVGSSTKSEPAVSAITRAYHTKRYQPKKSPTNFRTFACTIEQMKR